MPNENQIVLEQFAEKLLAAKGIFGLEQEVLDKMKSELLLRLSEWLNIATVKALPETVLPEAEKLLIAGDMVGLQALFQKEIPNLQEFLNEEMLKFKDAYLK